MEDGHDRPYRQTPARADRLITLTAGEDDRGSSPDADGTSWDDG